MNGLMKSILFNQQDLPLCAFEADQPQQYRRFCSQTIGEGFGSRIGLESHNFKGIVSVTSVALTGTMNSNKSNKQSLSIGKGS